MTKCLTITFVALVFGPAIALSPGYAIAQPQSNSTPQPLIDLSVSLLPDITNWPRTAEDITLPLDQDISFQKVLAYDLSMYSKLCWTKFDGDFTKSQTDQAKANIAIAGSEFANQRDQIRVDVETGFLTLQSQQQQIESAQVGLTSAQEQLRLARLRFDGGVGTQLDILNAQSKLAQAQSNISKAITAYNKAFAQLQRAMNQL